MKKLTWNLIASSTNITGITKQINRYFYSDTYQVSNNFNNLTIQRNGVEWNSQEFRVTIKRNRYRFEALLPE